MAGRTSRKRGSGRGVEASEIVEWKTALEDYCDAVDHGEMVPDEYLEAANLVAAGAVEVEPETEVE